MRFNLTLTLLCNSLIFFVSFIMIGLLSLVNPDRNLFWGIVPTVVGIVSLYGTFVAIREIRKESKQWYFGIPHAIVLIVLSITGPVFLVAEGGNHVDYLYPAFRSKSSGVRNYLTNPMKSVADVSGPHIYAVKDTQNYTFSGIISPVLIISRIGSLTAETGYTFHLDY